MRKQHAFVIVILAAALAVGAVFVIRSVHGSVQGGAGRQLPGAYGELRPGMTEAEVAAKLGKPESTSVNAKFVHKSPAEWAQIQAQVDSSNDATNDPNAIPSPQIIKLRMELQHHIKDIWTYQPNKYIVLLVDFDDSGHLIKWGTAAVMPSGARSSTPAEHAALEKPATSAKPG